MIATLPAAIVMSLKRDYNIKKISIVGTPFMGGFDKKIIKSVSNQSAELRWDVFKTWTIDEEFKLATEIAEKIKNCPTGSL